MVKFNRASEFLDEPNEYRILRLARESEVTSRTEIARRCQISKPTVSEIVNRLLRGGFLIRVGESLSTSRGGRKRELLRFNPHAGYVVGIEIGRTECIVALTDLNANVLDIRSFDHDALSPSATVLKRIQRSIESLLMGKKRFAEKCVGIGIGLPGVIDHTSGVVRVADTLKGWEGLELRKHFATKFDVPIYVDNDVKTRTLAEFLFGAGRRVNDQVFLWVGEGIGVGIIVDGKLHRGITESAGEIGYNELRFGAAGKELFPILYDGQRDYGDILGNSEIVRRYTAAKKTTRPTTIETILNAAENGEALARALMEEVALLISIVCITLINTLNPQLLVLAGRITETGSFLLDRVRQRVREDLLSVPAEAVTIVASQLSRRNGVILGAAGLVLYDLFKPMRNVVAPDRGRR
jgi:predicted NBD/HSP70 family sugar kinase